MADTNTLGTVNSFTNPLDNFQSHSIHYVMLAARTTEEARAFTDVSNNVATLEAITNVKRLGDPVVYGGSNSTAYLVMDTRRFSQFSIDHLEYEILINGLEAKASTGNFANTLKMSVLDSVGISFINFMQWLMNEKMQCNFDGMIYMLRILFVGHHPNGQTETVQSVTIPMHLLKMNLDLSFAKGAYDIEFMPNMNFDTSKNSRWLQIAATTTYSTPKGSNKLGDMVDALEKSLNATSQEYFNKARGVLTAAGRANENDPAKGFGRLVQYQITIPQEWQNFEFLGASSGNATETQFAGTAQNIQQTADRLKQHASVPGQPTDSKYAGQAGTTITAILDDMFKQAPDVAKLGMNQYRAGTGGQITFYKYLTGITSNDTRMTIHVDVIPYEVPNVAAQQGETKVAAGDEKFYQMIDGKRVPHNYFEYNYIFTGKNIDVLDFDMKFQDLQWMLASNLDLGSGAFDGIGVWDTEATNTTGPDKPKPSNKVSELMSMRAYDPLLPPVNTASEFENFSQYTSLLPRNKESEIIKVQQDYTRNLAKFYACAPVVANMTLRGNPDLMAKFNIPNFLPGSNDVTVGARSTASKAQYRKSLESEILLKNAADGRHAVGKTSSGAISVSPLGTSPYVNSPVFIKLNIKGPNVDYITAETVQGEDFAKDVLPDNFYVVMKVKNVIDGVKFTQELQLYSHNIFGSGKLTTADTTKNVRSE